MTRYTLTILDTVGIQNYIFAGNRLRDNIGASELVKQATQTWPYQLLPSPNNIADAAQRRLNEQAKIETDNLAAEVIYAGGGNTLILFKEAATAKDFAAQLGQKLLLYAPGIELAVVHYPFDWADDPLGGEKSGAVFEAFNELTRLKRSQAAGRSMAGLGVTAVCQSTGLPAVTTNAPYKVDGEAIYPISAEVAAKLAAAKEAMTELGRRSDGSPYRIPFSFEELGASPGEASYIAVVHIDGNNLGARVEMIAANHNRPAEGNRAYITAIRQFSRSVRQAAETSLERLRREIIASVRGVGAENETIMGIVPVRNGFIPYRPLVFGGDDLTFVCDGRLALTLVAYYLQTFEQETANAGLPNLRACAGISVVKSHYPFARAYELAEALCRNAKKWAKENGGDCSALDWHIAPGGLVGDLDFIRAREYAAPGAGSLLMRPIALDSDRHEWRNWPAFKDVVTAFKKDWADKRNKVKRLQEALRAGPEGVAQFLAAYPDPGRLPAIKASNRNIPRVGWDQGRCAYFDAIEAMEFFVPLHYEGGQL